MKEKNEHERVVKQQAFTRKKSFFILSIILICSIVFLIRYFSPTEKKSFSLRKENDKIKIYELNEEDIDKIDWQKGAEWTNFYYKKQKQYLLKTKREFFTWLIKKSPVYTFETTLEEHEIRGKDIEFEGCPNKKDIRIPKTKSVISSDLFPEKSVSLADLVHFVFYILVALLFFYIIDNNFGTNILGLLSSPFSAWRKNRGETIAASVKFKDIGGLQEAKEELGEIISYFQNPQHFWQRGATIPKGILLVGPPGNGKTLLAKALAGECGLPFLFRSGSDFEEALVGLGARRVRELFHKARNFPNGCIIFIDEIDSIGRKRYSSGTTHTELTLNQLLSELDGFRPRDNIVLLAATNSLNVLDKALLRPGRFDRHIYIPSPNLKTRRAIIQLCAKKLNFKKGIDLEEVACMTKGFSGAQITNMFNEASILSIRYGKDLIDLEIIFEAFDRVLMGPSLVSHTLTPEKRKIVAYHEAGHAVVGMSLPETTVKKITIIPRLSAGGYTWVTLRDEESDDNLINKSQMLAHVMSFLGGRASEELIFGLEKITMGAYDDFKKASAIIRDLIFSYGMSELGIIPTQESIFYSEEMPAELPETTKQKIENEREKILNQCWAKVKYILRQKKKILRLLAETLLEKNSLQKEEINYIFINQLSPYIPLLIANHDEQK